MREPAQIRMLPDGRRLHLHDGPIDLIVQADGKMEAVKRAYHAAAARFVTILDELCAELPLLRAQALPGSPRPNGPIARRMYDAVSRSAGFQPAILAGAPPSLFEAGSWPSEFVFITPMAAVAGAVAEAILGEMTRATELERAYVNNGGDIALYLAPGHSYAVGMIERPESASLFGSVQISSASPIRGIATSGWRGRSFSLGIADAVTVLAERAAEADAAATVIANAVDLPAHPAVLRVPARQIAPDSDLYDIPVTHDVGPLTSDEIEEALRRGMRTADTLRARGLIHSAALCLQGRVRIIPACRDGFLPALKHEGRPSATAAQTELGPSRSSPHA
jgi:uncharacterized protein